MKIRGTENRGKTKRISLHRVFIRSTAVELALIILLFAVLDAAAFIYTSSQVQNRQRENFSSAVSEYNSGAAGEAQYLRDLVINSNLVERIAGGQNSLDVFNAVEDLMEQLQSRQRNNPAIAGYYISYGENKSRYHFLESYTDVQLRREILDAVREQTQAPVYSWNTISAGDRIYLIYTADSRGVSITSIFDPAAFCMEMGNLAGENPGVRYIVLADDFAVDASSVSAAEDVQSFREGPGAGKDVLESGTVLGSTRLIAVYDRHFTDYVPLWMIIMTAAEIVLSLIFARERVSQYRSITVPLQRLISTMETIRSGKVDEKIDASVENVDEFYSVDVTMNSMMDEIMALKIRNYEEKLSRQEAQLQYLQLQLRPHFYLNCLKTINAFAVAGEPEKMQDMIIDVSKYFRYLFRNNKELVPLKEEMDFTENCCDLRRAITSVPFTWHMSADPGTEDFPVPQLVIQTFVENSIKYADPEGELHVEVHISLIHGEEDMLDIVVRDNGKGYSKEMLEKISRHDVWESAGDEGSHVGILNLRRRLNLIYGDLAAAMFHNQNGAVSEVILPRNVIKKEGKQT